MTEIVKHAVFSKCRKYRYLLTRDWEKPVLSEGRGRLTFIMLNPSKADQCVDDPTIRRCMGFARREGYCGIQVVNLFAWRSTDPAGLMEDGVEPVGPENDDYIKRCLTCGEVVAAWGRHAFARQRAREVATMLAGVRIMCLGTTKNGSPRHPLLVRGDAPFVPWEVI